MALVGKYAYVATSVCPPAHALRVLHLRWHRATRGGSGKGSGRSTAGATNSDAIVSMLWNHVMGKPALTAEKTPFITMLDSGSITRGGLVALAAETAINAENINLVGLRQSGIDYL